MLEVNSKGGEGAAGGGMNPAIKKHLELQINTLQNAPRDTNRQYVIKDGQSFIILLGQNIILCPSKLP